MNKTFFCNQCLKSFKTNQYRAKSSGNWASCPHCGHPVVANCQHLRLAVETTGHSLDDGQITVEIYYCKDCGDNVLRETTETEQGKIVSRKKETQW